LSLLSLGLVLRYNVAGVNPNTSGSGPAEWTRNLPTHWGIGLLVAMVSFALIAWAVWQSRRETQEIDGQLSEDPPKRD
jgi:hypothetical protein